MADPIYLVEDGDGDVNAVVDDLDLAHNLAGALRFGRVKTYRVNNQSARLLLAELQDHG